MKRVDLDQDEARAVMATAEYRLVGDGLQIKFRDLWWDVARTALTDDVCTTLVADKTLEEWVSHYRRLNRLGVRLRNEKTFAVVDRASDG